MPDALAEALAAGDGPTIVVPAGRQPALRRVRPVRARRSRSRTSTAPGCTSTARSGSGPPRRRALRAPGRRASTAPTRGPPTRTRRSTCPTTAASRSSRDPAAAAGGDGHAGQLPRSRTPGRATRSTRCRSCPGGPAACRCGRRCARSAAPASPTWSTGWPRTPARSPTASPPIAGAEVLNDVVFTQVCVAFGDDERTRAVTAAAARRRRRLDVRLALARPRRAADLGEQLVDRRRRRRRSVDAVRRAALGPTADGA